eukprot:403372278
MLNLGTIVENIDIQKLYNEFGFNYKILIPRYYVILSELFAKMIKITKVTYCLVEKIQQSEFYNHLYNTKTQRKSKCFYFSTGFISRLLRKEQYLRETMTFNCLSHPYSFLHFKYQFNQIKEDKTRFQYYKQLRSLPSKVQPSYQIIKVLAIRQSVYLFSSYQVEYSLDYLKDPENVKILTYYRKFHSAIKIKDFVLFLNQTAFILLENGVQVSRLEIDFGLEVGKRPEIVKLKRNKILVLFNVGKTIQGQVFNINLQAKDPEEMIEFVDYIDQSDIIGKLKKAMINKRNQIVIQTTNEVLITKLQIKARMLYLIKSFEYQNTQIQIQSSVQTFKNGPIRDNQIYVQLMEKERIGFLNYDKMSYKTCWKLKNVAYDTLVEMNIMAFPSQRRHEPFLIFHSYSPRMIDLMNGKFIDSQHLAQDQSGSSRFRMDIWQEKKSNFIQFMKINDTFCLFALQTSCWYSYILY